MSIKELVSSRTYISAAVVGLSLILILFTILCARESIISSESSVSEMNMLTATTQITVTPTDVWFGLLEKTPTAHTTPLPNSTWTPIDGTYAKLDLSEPQWWACRRCADYRPAGGIWKLQFDKGVMRIYYDVTSWRSIASYTVSGDHLYIFNDPSCPQDVGEYKWRLEDKWNLRDRSLRLDVVDDSCSIRLRAKNLSNAPWLSCMPPNDITGASGHWHKPPGCEQNPALLSTVSPSDILVTVIVHPGNAHTFTKQPDIYADANGEGMNSPEGIVVTYSDDSIPYGLNRVLWGEGDWVQVSTDLSFESMGVQVFGDHTIGWARVLFDGAEVWRGDTSEIWSYLGRHGGYIEVSDYEQGMHRLRIESLGFDYHPVTIAYFGFNHQGGVETE
jgi:hypothetical protein